MNPVWASLVVAVAAGIAVAAMLLVRRNAPDGGYFNDGDRASGVFGVLICYARSVVSQQWPRMEAGVLGEQISPWGQSCSGRRAGTPPWRTSTAPAFAGSSGRPSGHGGRRSRSRTRTPR